MSTEKTIKIQKNKVLTYSVNKAGFKTVYGSTVVSENQTINVEMKNLSSETGAFQLGDRLFGISSFVDYFTPDTENGMDKDSLKYISASQTIGTGLTNIQVVKGTSNTVGETGTWLSKVETELGIETPKGTSNNFIFTYNGSTWDITGALTLAGQSLENFGISFDGTATSGDVITVVETQYNKFAFFVLDANYRLNSSGWGSNTSNVEFPVQYTTSNATNCKESATYFNDYAKKNFNLSQHTSFNNAKNIGNFILNNSIILSALVPNIPELKSIWTNRVVLDTFDQSGSSTNLLSSWSFHDNLAGSCLEENASKYLTLNNSGTVTDNAYAGKTGSAGFIPIFEVPVM